MKNLPFRILEVAVVIAVVVLIWSNVMLRRENLGLSMALEQSRRMASSRVFHPGERFEFGGLVSPAGTVMTPSQAPRGRELVLIVDPNCGTCEEAAKELRAQQLPKALPPVIVSNGDASETAAFAKRVDVAGLVFRTPDSLAPEVRTKYSKTPQVFLVSGGMVTRVCGSVEECVARVQSK